jgi:hypothetical protein
MNTLSASFNRMALETTLAILCSLVVGVLAALVMFSQGDSGLVKSMGLAPSALSLLSFVVFALFRLTRITTSNSLAAIATLCGIAVVAVAGSVLILMVSCRYDACINL